MNCLRATAWLLTGALVAAIAPAAGLAAWPWSTAPAQPVREQTPHPAVARIIVPEQGGATSYGSGTLVDAHGEFGLVVTNWHVVRDAADKIEVVFPNGFRSFARALKVDADWDLAALVIWRPEIEPVPIATAAPRPGDVLTIAGYGSGTFRAATGRCTQYFAPDLKLPKELVEVSVQARHGDSGGPILNERGELAGVLFGASHGTTMGSYAGRVRGFLASVAPGLGEDRTQIAANPATSPAQRPAPSQVAVQKPAPSPSEERWRPQEPQTVAQPLASVPRPSDERLVHPTPPRTESFASAPQATMPAQAEHQPWPRRPSAADRDWSEFVQLSENPPGRTPRSIDPPPGEPSAVASLSAPADAVPQAQALTWNDLAGETIFDQVKTVLALIGGFAVVYLLLRACGG